MSFSMDRWMSAFDLLMDRARVVEQHVFLSVTENTGMCISKAAKIVNANKYNFKEFYEPEVIAELINMDIFKLKVESCGNSWDCQKESLTEFVARIEQPIDVVELRDNPIISKDQLWGMLFKRISSS